MPIRILDPATVGRIAAGEVVERPSSVAKELIENSLDAGATAIVVEIKGGGIESLRVTDNGCGIEASQARMAFENHATSKLQTAEQLDDIRTLGFRGEALPSIAAVSHVEMRTRARGQDTGVRVFVDGGKDLRVEEYGCPDGTTFLVKDLFYNIPVRRAFLKKPAYEASLVSDVVARLLIGNPGVSMRLINNGTTVYHSFGDGKLQNAIFAVYGKETAEKMVPVDAMQGGTKITGCIGVGDQCKATRAHQMFFINGRSVRCPMLSRALEEVCRTRVTIGMYPMCALNLTLPPHAIDVNVHPNKLEVRFRDEAATYEAVQAMLASAFSGEHVLDLQRAAAPVPEIVRRSTVRQISPAELADKPQQTDMFQNAIAREREKLSAQTGSAVLREVFPESAPEANSGAFEIRTDQSLYGAIPTADKTDLGLQSETEKSKTDFGTQPAKPAMPPLPQRQQDIPVQVPEESRDIEINAPEYRLIGVAFRTYIILEVQDALLIIDQHAAHERLLYEKYQKQLSDGIGSQQLLTPIVLHLSPREMATIQENAQAVEEAGYVLEPFGESEIKVCGVPHILGRAELRPIFLEMIGNLNRLKSATLDARRAEIMQMSCKAAVKGGDALAHDEITTLLKQMQETGAPPTCPHGRPVVRTVQRRELEKLFKRIQ